MNVIKVGFLISYDYNFIRLSLPRVYDLVDEIVFAVDVDNKTWSGGDFTIDDEFWEWVKTYDVKHKIRIYRDNFYRPELTPMECDTRERNMLGQQMGKCDWYVQVDSDEYFVDFASFTAKLRTFKAITPTTILCKVATLFKQVDGGFLIIGKSTETLSFATNNPVYDHARNNISGNKHELWDDLVLHQSWARAPGEIYWKLNNWSHKHDFNTESFYNLWMAIDANNYYGLKNFHPLDPQVWPQLNLITGSLETILNTSEMQLMTLSETVSVRRKPLLSRLWREIKSSF